MADIKKELNDIKNAVYGKEVRGAIHDGIKKINEEVEDATDLSESAKHQVENIQQQVNQLVVEGDSSVEAAQARVDADGYAYTTLKERLDTEHTEVTAQLADNTANIGDFINGNPVHGLWEDLQQRGVNVKWFGAKGDGITDDTAAIQAADDLVANGGKVYFPTGNYIIKSQINKSAYTTWEGIAGNKGFVSDATHGTALLLDFDGILVNIDETATVYGYGGIRNIAMLCLSDNYTNAVAVRHRNGVRQQFYDNIYMRNFRHRGFDLVGGGEIYIDNTFVIGSVNSFYCRDLADSWFTKNHGGTGYVEGEPGRFTFKTNSPSGNGFYFENCHNITLNGNRSQTSTLNGMVIRDCKNFRLIGQIHDQSKNNGLQIINSSNIDIIGCDIFDNGETTAKKPGILITATDLKECKNITMVGGRVRDRDKGTEYETQDRGILFSVSNGGIIKDVSLIGVDFTEVVTPLSGTSAVTGLKVRDCINYRNENGGDINFSGDGSTTTFNIPHGLVSTPKITTVNAKSPDARGDFHVFAGPTNIQVIFATAPASGTNNVSFYWEAKV